MEYLTLIDHVCNMARCVTHIKETTNSFLCIIIEVDDDKRQTAMNDKIKGFPGDYDATTACLFFSVYHPCVMCW